MAQVTTSSESGAEGFGSALRRLKHAQKSGKGAPPYSLYVNRPLGRVFAAAAYQVGLTPNQVTLISGAFTFVGIGIVAVRSGNLAVRHSGGRVAHARLCVGRCRRPIGAAAGWRHLGGGVARPHGRLRQDRLPPSGRTRLFLAHLRPSAPGLAVGPDGLLRRVLCALLRNDLGRSDGSGGPSAHRRPGTHAAGQQDQDHAEDADGLRRALHRVLPAGLAPGLLRDLHVSRGRVHRLHALVVGKWRDVVALDRRGMLTPGSSSCAAPARTSRRSRDTAIPPSSALRCTHLDNADPRRTSRRKPNS